MAKFLSEDWIAEYKKVGGALPSRPGKNAIIQQVVTDGPDGEVRYFQEVKDGVTIEMALGEHPKPDVTLTSTHDVALGINKGEINPNVAFMTGRVKPKGNVAKMMSLLPLSQSSEYQAMEKHMADFTDE